MKKTDTNRGTHPNSLQALGHHQWKPGQSGNPAGRGPKHSTIAMITAKICAKPVPSELLTKTKLGEDEVVRDLQEEDELSLGSLFVYLELRRALGGNEKAAERVWRYGSGLTLGILEVEHGLNPVDREFLKQCFDAYQEKDEPVDKVPQDAEKV